MENASGLTLGLIAALSVLAGVWAKRCSVFILVPLIGLAFALSTLAGMALGESAGGIAAGTAVAIACLEGGYVAALIIPALIAPALNARDADGSVQTEHAPALLAELAYLPLSEGLMEDAAGARRRLRRHAAET
jgi:hypothetical protein